MKDVVDLSRDMESGLPSEEDGKRAFNELKPVCVRVMTSPSLENLADMRSKVESLSLSIHPHLVDYVLLPVKTLLRRYGR